MNQELCTHADFSGSLSEILLFDVYRQIYLTRQTGTLEVAQDDAVKRLSFRRGSLIFATTNRDSERLGILLVSSGKITQYQLDLALRESRGGKRLGQTLLKRGLISREELDGFVRQHQSEVAISALAWNRGSFVFKEDLPSQYQDVFIELSTAQIILEGVRRIKDAPVVEKLLGSLERKLRLAADPLLRFQKVSLTPQQGYLLSRLEQSMSIGDICRISALGEAETRKQLLGFVLAGILDYDEAPPAESPDTVTEAEPQTMPPQGCDAAVPDVEGMNRLLESKTPYQLLAIAPDASTEEIRQAYFSLSKRYHPDNVSRSAPQAVAQMVEKVFRAIETAYAVLATPAQREVYDRQMARSNAASLTWDHDCGPAVRKQVNEVARREFDEGVELYDRGAYLTALAKFNEAVRIERNMATYRFYLAETLAHLPGRERDAEFQYRVAIQLAPGNGKYRSALKKLRQSPGLQERAESLMSEAVAELNFKSSAPKSIPRR